MEKSIAPSIDRKCTKRQRKTLAGGRHASDEESASKGDAWRNSFSERVRNSKTLNFGFQCTYIAAFAPGEFLAFCLAGGAKSKALLDEGIVVLLVPLLVGPIIGANLRLQNQLVALARILCDCFPQSFERHEPKAGDRFAGVSLFILSRIVITDQAYPGIGGISLDGQLRILGEVADGNEVKAVHESSPLRLVFATAQAASFA